jgi:hypothetical protein
MGSLNNALQIAPFQLLTCCQVEKTWEEDEADVEMGSGSEDVSADESAAAGISQGVVSECPIGGSMDCQMHMRFTGRVFGRGRIRSMACPGCCVLFPPRGRHIVRIRLYIYNLTKPS